jgi:hypothetical protein
MLMLLLTAREGRLSANQLGCPSSRSPQTPTHVRPTSRAAAFVCLVLSSSGDPNDKTGSSAGVLYRH